MLKEFTGLNLIAQEKKNKKNKKKFGDDFSQEEQHEEALEHKNVRKNG